MPFGAAAVGEQPVELEDARIDDDRALRRQLELAAGEAERVVDHEPRLVEPVPAARQPAAACSVPARTSPLT